MLELIKPSIKKKIFFGFVIIGAILFFAGVIAIFEFRKINEMQSGIVEDNIKSINTANVLLSLTEDYNIKILNTLDQDDAGGDIIEMLADEDFMTQLGQIKGSFSSERESVMADSVLFAYAAYMQVVREAENIWPEGYQARNDWYFNRLQSFYVRLRDYIHQLTTVSKDILVESSYTMQDTFYRSIMPSIASMLVGIIVVILFNIFINYYFVDPILKITKGIDSYRKYGKEYNVDIDNDGDEIAELNNSVSEIVTDCESYTKQQ